MSARLLLPAVLALSLGACIHRPVTDGHLFQPGRCTDGEWPATLGSFAVQRAALETADGESIETIELRHASPRATLVYFGGNSLRHCPATLASPAGQAFVGHMAALGLNVVLVNYRGYGASTGRPTFEQGRADAIALFDRVAAAASVPLLVHGQSLGSVFATEVARTRPVAGLVLESAPTTIGEVLRAATPWYARPFLRLDVSPELARVDHRVMARDLRGPVLLVTGAADRMTPPRMARELSAAIGPTATVVVVDGGGHGDLVLHDGFWTAVARYVDRQLETASLTMSPEAGGTPAPE